MGRHRIHGRRRRGVALMDAILGGLLLSIGLAVSLTLASRSLAMQGQGQHLIAASWLVDELLSMVVVEGPVTYPQLYATYGRFEAPFDVYEYEVSIDDIGLGKPFLVTATVRWPHGRDYRYVEAQTYVAERRGEPFQIRSPLEPIDRFSRYYDDDE